MGRKKRHSDRYDWEDEQEDDLTPQSFELQKASPLQSRVAALAKQRKEQESPASAKGAEQTKAAAKQEPKKKPERKAKPKNNEPKAPFFVRLSYLISWLTALTLVVFCLVGSTVAAREIFNSDNGWIYRYIVYPAAIASLFWIYLLQFQYLFLIPRRGRQAITRVWIYAGAIAALVFAAAATAKFTHGQVDWLLIKITLIGVGVWLVGIINRVVNNWRQKKLLDLSFAKKADFVPVKWLSIAGWLKKLIAILIFLLTVYLTTMDLHKHVENSEEQSAPQALDDSNTQLPTTLESSLHENHPDL